MQLFLVAGKFFPIFLGFQMHGIDMKFSMDAVRVVDYVDHALIMEYFFTKKIMYGIVSGDGVH